MEVFMKGPELVLPAGTLEKLKTAVLFGADAVYFAGKEFGLRAYAGNLSRAEIEEGLAFAHSRKKKAYLAVNILAHNQDMHKLPAYLEEMANLQPDGFIISDLGVLRLAQKYAPSIPLTISTQANVSNYEAASFFQDLGARRIVLARELNLGEIEEIKKKSNVEIEIFVHGAMCVSYSGRCLLSCYMTGRNANQGACAHPCRYRYALVEEKRPGEYFAIEEDKRGSYILNSRDLCLLEYIPRLVEAGVDALKVEGRMKSPLYIASVASVYRQAIDRYRERATPFTAEELSDWMAELHKTATRPFTSAFIGGEEDRAQDIDKEEMPLRAGFCAIVTGYREQEGLIELEQRANFGCGDYLEFLLPGGELYGFVLEKLYDEDLSLLDRARHPQQKVLIPFDHPLPEFSILRKGGKINQG
mgnify:FL=1